MKIDAFKLDMALARKQTGLFDLRSMGFSSATLTRVRKGGETSPKTVGRIAAALGCDPADIIQEEVSNSETAKINQ